MRIYAGGGGGRWLGGGSIGELWKLGLELELELEVGGFCGSSGVVVVVVVRLMACLRLRLSGKEG